MKPNLSIAIRAASITLDVHSLNPANGCCRACGTPGWCPINQETSRWLTDLHLRDATDAGPSDNTVTYARIVVYRDTDISGVSGPGPIADGAIWDDGYAVIYWRGTTTGIRQEETFKHWSQIEAIHGHQGSTRLVWLDPPPVAC